MKLTVLSENLAWGLSVASKGVASRAQLPVLANILLRAESKGLTMLSTDLEIGFRVQVGAKVEKEGEMVVSGRILAELVSTLPEGPVELGMDKDRLMITASGVKAEVTGMAAGEFPEIPTMTGKEDFVLPQEALVNVVERVGFSASREDTRPVLTGILWRFEVGGVEMVATDGYRLSVAKLEVGGKVENKRLVLPARALVELIKVLEKEGGDGVKVKFEEDKQQVVLKAGKVEVVSRLLSGEFPPYEKIMPTEWETRVMIDKMGLREAVRRAEIFARDSANIVRLSVVGGELVVGANSAQLGKSETRLNIEKEGEDLKAAFNGKYLLEYLDRVDTDEVVFESSGSLKPGVFKPMKSGKVVVGWTHVVMPVRVEG